MDRIMIVVDTRMRHSTAFQRGVALAGKTGASLILLLVDHNPAVERARILDPGTHAQAVQGFLAVRRRWLDFEVAKLQEQGMRAAGIAAWHKPAYEEISRQAMRQAPDIVIKDAAETGRFSRAVFTPVDWHLLRLCPAPLLVVSPHSSTWPQRILAAVDPFDTHGKPAGLNDAILRAALILGRQCDAPVHLVHAWQYGAAATPPPDAGLAGIGTALFEELRDEHRQDFIALGEKYGVPAGRMHLLAGPPAEVIATLAEDINADLVVLGTAQRTGLERVLMGATAEDILDSINSDVLAIKPAGFAETLKAELAGRERGFGNG
ncbi:MAG TPA: universal stress protein [Ferrovibrio sp.]|uniref:universal stress protein n=1 Tax=Ferrovibrio sp. TaxID=1917215 RepID=UPI002ED58ECD